MRTLHRRDLLRGGMVAAAGLGAWLTMGAGAVAQAGWGTGKPCVPSGALEDRRNLTGDLLLPCHPRYNDASKPANGRYDSILPLAVAQCADEADVVTCIKWSVANGVSPVARGGGHSYAGFSTTIGLLIDLKRLHSVQLNTATGEAIVGGGARNRHLFDAAIGGRFILPGGTCLGVGIGGLVLGGGIGYNTHWAGLTSDHLQASRIVTAAGEPLTINAAENADLFWACRGGAGGSFGINTSFTFTLQPVPQSNVTYFRLEWRGAEAAKGVFAAFHQILLQAPPAFNAVAMAQALPGADPRQAITVMSRGHFLGSSKDLTDLLAPLMKVGTPQMDMQEMAFWDMQQIWPTEETLSHSFGDLSRYADKPLPEKATNALVERLAVYLQRTDNFSAPKNR